MRIKPYEKIRRCGPAVPLLLFTFVTLAGFMVPLEVPAHGGKTHGESVTALEAFQKATALYDRLIADGKLDESWEAALEKVDVITRRHQDALEYRVGFHRSAGDPQAVYIFLSSEGEYTGSNFDGKW